MAERITRQRLPKVKWSEYSTKKPRSRTTTQNPGAASGATIGMTPQAGLSGLPAQPNIRGPHFALQGKAKFYNPLNVKGQQFNKPAIHQAAEGLAYSHLRSQYFRRAGFGAALRYTLGMEQTPSHVQDYLNSRQRRQTGLNPGDVNAMTHDGADQW